MADDLCEEKSAQEVLASILKSFYGRQLDPSRYGEITQIPAKNNSERKTPALSGNSKLKTITIGSGIKSFGWNSLGCNSLERLIINKTCATAEDVPTLNASSGLPTTAIVIVPDETTKTLFEANSVWANYTIQVAETVSE